MEPENTVPDDSSLPRKGLLAIFMNHRGLRAGWRLLIFSALVFVAILIFGTGAVLVMRKLGYPLGSFAPGSQFIGEVSVFLATLVSTWLMSRIERRKLGEFGLPIKRSAVPNFFRGYFLWGFVPLSLLLLVMRLLHLFDFGSVALHRIDIFYWAGVWGLVFLSVAFVEEYLYRGYVLSTLADGLGFWPAAIILAAFFAYLHTSNPGETRMGIIGVAAFALFASATIRRTGNLWLAVGAHAGWDWAQSYFYGVNDSGIQIQGHLLDPHISGPAWLTGGSAGPEGSVLTLALLVAMTALFLLRGGSKPVSA
ncbi:MAG TPA: type II CAAX endopeptidase family protein [Candidatus Angelobacter sp.]|nr:type II CAAX endopeptidase family protein [Candidatus Angelobacter sp.]